jgi:tRNA(adenine34) deaminase
VNDEYFMGLALEQAGLAAGLGEAPVGAVIIKDGEVLASGHNRRETGKNALCHAELIAINEACRKLGGWRLFACDIYVTLEPCPMCAGAAINARLRRVVFGALDPKAGCFGTVANFNRLGFNHRPQVMGGVLAEDCGLLLSDFFAALRENGKINRNSGKDS